MGTYINMVSVSRPSLLLTAGNSISVSSKAAKKCLGVAGIHPGEIGLLINTGVYRYRNTGEPSNASLVQKKINGHHKTILPFFKKPARDKNPFSFDLNQGACGWLTGVQVVDGFIQTGDISHGMVVTGDTDPFTGFSVNYPFEGAAAAILLSASEAKGGFHDFKSYSYPAFMEDFISSTRFGYLRGKKGKSNVLYVRQRNSYLENCLDCAVESLNKYLNDTGLRLREIDLILPSQSPAGLVHGLRSRTGMGQKIVDADYAGGRELHTAGPAFALEKSWEEKSFRSSRNILFLTVGSGISVSLVFYQNIF